MAYKIKTPQEFEKQLNYYLNKHPLKLDYEETLINNFSSSNLSDLYKLFLDLEDSKLETASFEHLKEIINQNFDIDVNSIFNTTDTNNSSYCISKVDIQSLENIIKDVFLSYINEPEKAKNIDQKELYNLSVIVNKIFPEVFLNLIKTPNSDIKKNQEFIKNNILDTIDHWYQHTSKEAEEENKDIIGALYITIRKLYPELNFYIPGRTKSTRSSISNIDKEAKKSLSSLLPNDISKGLTDEEIEKQFNMEKANTDFTGFTIVLSNTDDTLHFDISEPKSPDLLALRKIREDNINFTHSLENFLSENDNTYFSNIELLQIKIDLLMRLRLTTYEECTKEFQNTSFSKLLSENIQKYTSKIENPNGEKICDNDITYTLSLNEIYELLDELKKRVHDKYQAKILEIVVPEILKDELLVDTLKLQSKFMKRVKKKNGFCTDYYELVTADGRKIELQVITNSRFRDSKDGSSDHSNLPNKEINISHFFEPTNPNCEQKDFNRLLNLLNNTPIAIKNTLYATPDNQLTPTDKRLKIKLKIAEQNVKLKDYFEEQHVFSDGTISKSRYSLDDYLLNFAEYVSPKLMSASSHHTRFNKGVAGYNKKSIISEFTEVLLKHDSTSCLSQILIDRLESIVPNDKNEISRNGIIKRANKRYSVPTANDDFEH